MTEHNPIYTPAITADTIQYKPLSLMAVAGLSLGSLFALLVLAFGGDALFRGQPFFLPTLLILVPIGGAVLSGLGLWEVNNSESTRAGGSIAKWGLGISLAFGAGYYTYQTITGLAIIQQANRFLLEKDVESGFFPRLQGGEVDVRTAFLFTFDAKERGNIRPEERAAAEQMDMPNAQMPKGALSRFLESHLVKIIRQAAPASVKIDPGAVKEWAYESGTYKIIRNYKITTDDGVWEVFLTLVSTEPEAEGVKRKWRVDWNQGLPLQTVSRTEQGRRKLALRKKSFEFLMNQQTGLFWNLTRRQGFEVYLAEQRPEERKELSQRAAVLKARTPFVAVAGSALPPPDLDQEESLRQAFLPGYEPLSKFGEKKVDMINLRFLEPKDVEDIRRAALEAFSLSKLPSLALNAGDDEFAAYKVQHGEVQIGHQFEIPLHIEKEFPNKQGRQPVSLLAYGTIWVAASDKIDPAASNADRAWRIIGIELTRAVPHMKQQQQQNRAVPG